MDTIIQTVIGGVYPANISLNHGDRSHRRIYSKYPELHRLCARHGNRSDRSRRQRSSLTRRAQQADQTIFTVRLPVWRRRSLVGGAVYHLLLGLGVVNVGNSEHLRCCGCRRKNIGQPPQSDRWWCWRICRVRFVCGIRLSVCVEWRSSIYHERHTST